MAKQDDGKKKDVKPPVVSRREPRVVQDTPDSLIKKGYVPVLRPDGVTEYVKKQDRPKAKQPVVPTKPRTAPTGKPKKVIRPRPTEQPGGESEDVVILKSETKEPEPSRSRSIPSQTGLFGEAVTTAQIRPEKQNLKNYGITTVSYPDVTGKTGATERDVYFDAEGNEVTYDMSDPLKNIVDGKFTPTKTGKTRDFYDREYGLSGIVTPLDSKVNRENPKFQGNLMMEGAQTTRVAGGGFGEIKTVQPKTFKSYMMPKYDASGNIINTEEQGLKESQVKQEGIMETGKMYEIPEEEVQTFTTPKFKKGGLVGKIKGYYQGGTATKMGGFNDLNSESIDKSDVDFLENENKKLLELRNEPVSTPKFKKGGIVGKVKGYYAGGTPGFDEFNPNVTGYSGAKSKQTEGEEDKEGKTNAGKAAQTIGKGLGAFGSSYYAMQQPSTKGEMARNMGMQAVGQIGPVGGAISGITSLAEIASAKKKEEAQRLNPQTGEILDEEKALRNARIGIAFDPTQRLKYEGGLTDVTGKKYLESLNKEYKKDLAAVKEANVKSKQQQALAAREAGEENPSYYEPYNLANARVGKDRRLEFADGTTFDPNMPTYAKGGTIKGPGTGTSDSILSKISKDGIPAGSFITPAKNNGLAKKIREKVLGDNPNKVAKFEKGGEMEDDADVAVSNGEHLFTPKEKKKIISYLGKEILEELAPEAEENEESENEMAMAAKGGELNKLGVKNSLLNNIRANAGSGKKPTPEMLKQEKEIKNSYAKGGYVVERSREREGKTHKVTAPDGTVQYFGDSNLGQHPDNPKRKKAFYARHAENLKNNPLFRAFARETWAEGGTVGSQMMDDDYITEMAKGGLTRSKAREILHDKSVRGKPLTDKQRKFMGAVASGYVEGYEKGGSVKAPKVMGYAKGTDADGVDPSAPSKNNELKRGNSTGIKSVDVMIDNAYKNPPKTEKELTELKSKIKLLTISDEAPSNKEVAKFFSWINPKIESAKIESDKAYKQNKELVEKSPDIIKNIKRLKDMGASNDILKQYTEEAKRYDESYSTVKYTPNELYDKYKLKVEDEDYYANKESVKKQLDDRVQSVYKKLEDVKNNPQNYTLEQVKETQDRFDNIASLRNDLNKKIDKHDIDAYKAAKEIVKKGTESLDTDKKPTEIPKITPKTETKPTDAVTETKPTETKPTETKTTGGVKAPKVAGGKKATSGVPESARFAPPAAVETITDEVVVPMSDAEKANMAKKEAADKAQADALNASLPQTVSPTQPQAKKKGVLDVVSGIDPTMFIGPLQAQAGMKMLKGEKRPVFKGELDPRYNKAVERAQYEAQFGLTPEQRFMAEQDIQKSLKDALAQGRSASSVESYNLNRAAANEAWRNKLGLKQADLGARMEKQQYADRMVAERAGIIERNRRQAFEDAMMGFQQRQGAGAQLVGAGLANTIGAYRFNQELKAQKERAGLDWSRNYGQQSSQTT